MLSIEQIVTLSEKGFTFDQIGKLNEILSEETKQPEPKPEPKLEPDTEPEPEPEPKKKNGIIENKDTDALEKRINDLESTIKTLQETNVKNAAHEPEKKITAKDVITSFMSAS